MEAREYTPNIDYVITASEFGIMLKEEDINFASLGDTPYDRMLGESSGSGVLLEILVEYVNQQLEHYIE